MRITIILAISAVYAGIFFSACNIALAQTSDIGQSQIHPSHPLYFLKTVRENLEMHFAQTPRVKMVRQLEFATRRLREVKTLLQIKDWDLVEPTMERYWFHMNTVLKYRPREEWLTLLLNYTISTHLNVLENIYGRMNEKRAKMSVRTTVHRILKYSDIIEAPRLKGCDFLAKEATSSSDLNQTERVILSERAEECFKRL
ncbi:MAG: DUF5667 domain-containing protein [Patescibacteria group bacterium]